MRIFKWAVRIIIFLFVLILTLNNLQTATFNFFGIYFLKVPLILIAGFSLVIGIGIGILLNTSTNFRLNSQIRKLRKEPKTN